MPYKDPAARREANKKRQAAYRATAAKKKAPVAAPTETAPDAPIVEDPSLLVEVAADVTPAVQPSLKDRFIKQMKGAAGTPKTGTAAPKKTAGRPKRNDPNLLTTMLPTVLASLIAVWAQSIVGEEYRACAPTKEEVASIIGPLFDILGRQVEIAAKVSQNTIDLIQSLVCAMMFATRSYVTYADIKREKEQPGHAEAQRKAYRDKLDREDREQQAAIADDVAALTAYDEQQSLARGLHAYQAAANGSAGHPGSSVQSSAAGLEAEIDAQRLTDDRAQGSESGKPDEAAKVHDLLRRDIEGRVRLGLLQPRVRDGS